MTPFLVAAVAAAVAANPKPGPGLVLAVAGKQEVLLDGPVSDLELREVAPPPPAAEPPDLRDFMPALPRPPRPAVRTTCDDPDGDGPGFSRLAGTPLRGVVGISSSGLGTSTGERRVPLPFATVTDPGTKKAMTFYAAAASDKGFVTRSSIVWGGDYLAGVKVAGRMCGRGPGVGDAERITAELHVRLPGDDRVRYVFVGYDADGRRVPAFCQDSFEEVVARVLVNAKSKRR